MEEPPGTKYSFFDLQEEFANAVRESQVELNERIAALEKKLKQPALPEAIRIQEEHAKYEQARAIYTFGRIAVGTRFIVYDERFTDRALKDNTFVKVRTPDEQSCLALDDDSCLHQLHSDMRVKICP